MFIACKVDVKGHRKRKFEVGAEGGGEQRNSMRIVTDPAESKKKTVNKRVCVRQNSRRSEFCAEFD